MSAKLDEAIWQGEKLLSLSKLGICHENDQLLSWIPTTDMLDVGKAIQIIEEPLQRLLAQLFWFDFEKDPNGKWLQEGLLKKDEIKLHKYLEANKTAFSLSQKDNSNSEQKEAGKSTQNPDAIIALINCANLEMLLAWCYFHELELLLKDRYIEKKPQNKKLKKLAWKKSGTVFHIINPHRLITQRQPQIGDNHLWQDLLSSAFKKWSQILNAPIFRNHILEITQQQNDDLLDESTIEILQVAIPNRLSDILVEKLKALINQGQQEKTKSLLACIFKSPFYDNLWKNNFHLLRRYYQIELTDLHKILDTAHGVDEQQFIIFFKRLEKIKKRWKKIDPNDVLDLDQLAEEMVLKAFNKITSLSYSVKNFEKIIYLLKEAAKTSTVLSLKNKIDQYQNKLIEYYSFNTCYYCEVRESNPRHPVVLQGKRETRREWNYNQETIYYAIKYEAVPRCDRCSTIHEFILKQIKAISTIILAFILLGLLSFGLPSIIKIGWPILFGYLIIAYLTYLLINYFLPKIISPIVAPNEKSCKNIHKSRAYLSLKKEGYGIEKIDIRKYALALSR